KSKGIHAICSFQHVPVRPDTERRSSCLCCSVMPYRGKQQCDLDHTSVRPSRPIAERLVLLLLRRWLVVSTLCSSSMSRQSTRLSRHSKTLPLRAASVHSGKLQQR